MEASTGVEKNRATNKFLRMTMLNVLWPQTETEPNTLNDVSNYTADLCWHFRKHGGFTTADERQYMENALNYLIVMSEAQMEAVENLRQLANSFCEEHPQGWRDLGKEIAEWAEALQLV